MFDHVEVVLRHLAPGTWHDFPVLLHVDVAARDGTEPGSQAVIVDDVIGHFEIKVRLALGTRQGVQGVGELVGSKALGTTKLLRLFLLLDELDFYDLALSTDIAVGRLFLLLLATVEDFVLVQAHFVAEIFLQLLLSHRGTYAVGNFVEIFLTIGANFEIFLVAFQTADGAELLDVGPETHAILAQRRGRSCLFARSTVAELCLIVAWKDRIKNIKIMDK